MEAETQNFSYFSCCVAVKSCLTLCDPTDCSLPRLLCAWDSPGKNTGVGCHSLLQGIFLTLGWKPRLLRWQADSLPSEPPGKPDPIKKIPSQAPCVTTVTVFIMFSLLKVAQPFPTLCDPMDCRLPASSVHETLQARILEWVAMPFFRGSSRPRDQTRVSCITGRFFTI